MGFMVPLIEPVSLRVLGNFLLSRIFVRYEAGFQTKYSRMDKEGNCVAMVGFCAVRIIKGT